jgi:hypothetical protein
MDKELPLWIVSRIKKSRAEQIATVRAKDAVSAVAVIVKQHSCGQRLASQYSDENYGNDLGQPPRKRMRFSDKAPLGHRQRHIDIICKNALRPDFPAF